MTPPQPHEDLSLEAIQSDRWGDAPDDASRLVKTVHELRRKPMRDLTPAELRVLIGQREGLDVLLPRALRQLAGNPLIETDFYPGDLLAAVLRVPREYWLTHHELLEEINQIIAAAEKPDFASSLGSHLCSEIDSFRDQIRA